jgi:hypothetical protein
MAWTLTHDIDEYDANAGPFMAARPVPNTVQLTVAATVRARGRAAFGPAPPVYGW